jgi:hypothetical protein
MYSECLILLSVQRFGKSVATQDIVASASFLSLFRIDRLMRAGSLIDFRTLGNSPNSFHEKAG